MLFRSELNGSVSITHLNLGRLWANTHIEKTAQRRQHSIRTAVATFDPRSPNVSGVTHRRCVAESALCRSNKGQRGLERYLCGRHHAKWDKNICQ